MTPPEAPLVEIIDAGDMPSAAPCVLTLKHRADFLAAARARRQGMGSMMVQARRRAPIEGVPDQAIRVGITCSKKVGNAVARNRAKRRLRAAARDVLPDIGHRGWDYVLIGRAGETAARPFELLLADLREAVSRLHTPRKSTPKTKRYR